MLANITVNKLSIVRSRDDVVNTPTSAVDATRFAFGRNWARFLRRLDDRRIALAETSLQHLTGLPDLSGKTMLDVGSGSGLFSLAARRLGAQVTSFDYDSDCVACTESLRERYEPGSSNWKVVRGSALDRSFMASLGQFDIVYSWGVLHHTGDLWAAVDNAASAVADGGQLCLALYNDQGGASRRWLKIKQLYNRLPFVLRPLFVGAVMMPFEAKWLLLHTLKGDLGGYIRAWTGYAELSGRGMSYWHDWVDWVGGLPFEVAKPETVFDYLAHRHFSLERLTTCGGGHACNEYMFRRDRRTDRSNGQQPPGASA